MMARTAQVPIAERHPTIARFLRTPDTNQSYSADNWRFSKENSEWRGLEGNPIGYPTKLKRLSRHWYARENCTRHKTL